MKNIEGRIPDIEVFEGAAARAWHSRMEGIDPKDQAVLDSMAGEVIAQPNKVYNIQMEASKIAERRQRFIENMNA